MKSLSLSLEQKARKIMEQTLVRMLNIHSAVFRPCNFIVLCFLCPPRRRPSHYCNGHDLVAFLASLDIFLYCISIFVLARFLFLCLSLHQICLGTSSLSREMADTHQPRLAFFITGNFIALLDLTLKATRSAFMMHLI